MKVKSEVDCKIHRVVFNVCYHSCNDRQTLSLTEHNLGQSILALVFGIVSETFLKSKAAKSKKKKSSALVTVEHTCKLACLFNFKQCHLDV